MKLRRTSKYIGLTLGVTALLTMSGCSEDCDECPSTPPPPSYDIPTLSFANFEISETIAEAIDKSTGTTSLIAYSTDGKGKSITDIRLFDYKAVSNGIYIYMGAYHYNQQGELKTPYTSYFISPNGSYTEIPTEKYSYFVAENRLNELIFEASETFNTVTLTTSRLETGLRDPDIETVSANLIEVDDSNTNEEQVYDTATGLSVLDSRLDVALSPITALDHYDIIDLETGNKSPADLTTWNGEIKAYTDNSGALLMTPYASNSMGGHFCDDNITTEDDGFCVYELDSQGLATKITDRAFKVAYNNNQDENENIILFADDNYIVIKGINEVSVIERFSENVTTVLDDYKVLSIEYRDSTIYFTAIDVNNNPVDGKYSIVTGNIVMYSDYIITGEIEVLVK